jgi:hypothetical protein
VDLRKSCDKDKEEPIARAEISYCVFDATYLETDLSSVIVDIHQKTLEFRLLENKNPEELQTMTDPLGADLLLSGRDLIAEKTPRLELAIDQAFLLFPLLAGDIKLQDGCFLQVSKYLQYLPR